MIARRISEDGTLDPLRNDNQDILSHNENRLPEAEREFEKSGCDVTTQYCEFPANAFDTRI